MVAAERTALVLLAAGRSQRFGAANKLTADLRGISLGLHVVAALEDVPFAARIAVVDEDVLGLGDRGYRVVRNAAPEAGMGRSVALGVAAARGIELDAVVIALADMPCVSAAHVLRLLEAADGPGDVVASSSGGTRSPPAVFGRAHFDVLVTLTGDAGARHLIRSGRQVIAAQEELVDIDTPDDLARLQLSQRQTPAA